MTMTFEAQVVPMQVDRDGVIRVGHTRVRLDTVVYAFNEGYTAEEIASQYPVLKLADIYAVIAYYLSHQATIDAYLKQRREAAAKVRAEIEAKPEYQALRERLLARQQKQQSRLSHD